MKCITYFIVLLAVHVCMAQGGKNEKQETYPEQVGDIPVPAASDSAAFRPCGSGPFRQYYEFGNGLMFEGEKRAIIDFFKAHFTPKDSFKRTTAFLTIRFIVNCKGETGWFRSQQVNQNLESVDVDTELAQHLISIISQLKGWGIPGNKESVFDYYQYFTFKVEAGAIKEILP